MLSDVDIGDAQPVIDASVSESIHHDRTIPASEPLATMAAIPEETASTPQHDDRTTLICEVGSFASYSVDSSQFVNRRPDFAYICAMDGTPLAWSSSELVRTQFGLDSNVPPPTQPLMRLQWNSSRTAFQIRHPSTEKSKSVVNVNLDVDDNSTESAATFTVQLVATTLFSNVSSRFICRLRTGPDQYLGLVPSWHGLALRNDCCLSDPFINWIVESAVRP
jgi:hypothetical protein